MTCQSFPIQWAYPNGRNSPITTRPTSVEHIFSDSSHSAGGFRSPGIERTRRKDETRESKIRPSESPTAPNKVKITHLNLIRTNLTLAEGFAYLDNTLGVKVDEAENVNPQTLLAAKLEDLFERIEVDLGLRIILPVNLKDIDAVRRHGTLHALPDGLFHRGEGVGRTGIAEDAPLVRTDRHDLPTVLRHSRGARLAELSKKDLGGAIVISYGFTEKYEPSSGPSANEGGSVEEKMSLSEPYSSS